jgi:hypothetical protein
MSSISVENLIGGSVYLLYCDRLCHNPIGSNTLTTSRASRRPPGQLGVKPNPSRCHPNSSLPRRTAAGAGRRHNPRGLRGWHLPPPTAAVCGVCPG